jgi:DNA modification methylase
VRSDDQIGLEATVKEYVANLAQVFREVKRVLRDDGTLWLNLSDTYKDKGLLGVPWRVAFALQADGWVLRSDIIWSKRNSMPESVLDRPTRSHEQVFLFSKQEHYYYDAYAIREPIAEATIRSHQGRPPSHIGPRDVRTSPPGHPTQRHPTQHHNGRGLGNGNARDFTGRNSRSVWHIASTPSGLDHYAAFPPELAERCILAGTSAYGVCRECGSPWKRITEVVGYEQQRHGAGKDQYHTKANGRHGATSVFTTGDVALRQTSGWHPTCRCACGEVRPARVFDPFTGTSTTLFVARALGRDAVGTDLSWEYLHGPSRTRLGLAAQAAWEGKPDVPMPVTYTDLPLFAAPL